ncbi:MAG: hypothetical protein ABL885_00555 [Methylophilaceae bacterium]
MLFTHKPPLKKARLHVTANRVQRGIVLFFALIALVVMSLAAVALIRSVDTNSMIAGNLAFRRAAVIAADSGTETALVWIDNNSGALIGDDTSKGYYATSVNNLLTPLIDESNGKLMVDANGINASGADFVAGTDKNGNHVTYVIQRMCKTTGAATPETCLYGPGASMQCLNNAGIQISGAMCSEAKSPIYRVTTKVVGPRNTVSYIQAFLS